MSLTSPSTPFSKPFSSLVSAASPSSAVHSPSSPSHVVDIVRPCPLLHVIPPVRSLMLDYMDDRTAITYLSTCRSLHVGYHSCPLKQAMSVETFREATRLDDYFRRQQRVCLFLYLQSSCLFAFVFSFLTPGTAGVVCLIVFGSLFAVMWSCIAWLLLTRRVDCCTRGRWGMWRGRCTMPRVTRLSEQLWDSRLLAYLQHLTELTTLYYIDCPISKKNPLPHSLRTLHLLGSPGLMLEPHTLPPRLTSLSLGAVKNTSLPAGVLPQSLTSLELSYDFESRIDSEVGVLPSNLKRLDLAEWTRSLSIAALPASLTELDLHSISNHPLPVLPSHLEVLRISGAFDYPLTGVLPSSLRVLRLTGRFDQPLTADMFASTPQLEELYLSDLSSARQLSGRVLPRSLRVLRLGNQYSLFIPEASDAPPQLRRLIVPAGWDVERVRRVEQFGRTQGFTVEQEAVA